MGRAVTGWARRAPDDAWRVMGSGELVTDDRALLVLVPHAVTLLQESPPPDVVLAPVSSAEEPAHQVLLPARIDVFQLFDLQESGALVKLREPAAGPDRPEPPSHALVDALRRGRSLRRALAPSTARAAEVRVPPDSASSREGLRDLRPSVDLLPLRTPQEVGAWICRIVPWCDPRGSQLFRSREGASRLPWPLRLGPG